MVADDKLGGGGPLQVAAKSQRDTGSVYEASNGISMCHSLILAKNGIPWIHR